MNIILKIIIKRSKIVKVGKYPKYTFDITLMYNPKAKPIICHIILLGARFTNSDYMGHINLLMDEYNSQNHYKMTKNCQSW